jgi:hypothetical protein
MYVNCTTQAVFIVVSCEAHNQSASWEVCTAMTSNGRETSVGWKPNGLILCTQKDRIDRQIISP